MPQLVSIIRKQEEEPRKEPGTQWLSPLSQFHSLLDHLKPEDTPLKHLSTVGKARIHASEVMHADLLPRRSHQLPQIAVNKDEIRSTVQRIVQTLEQC